MKTLLKAAVLLGLIAALSGIAFAQWKTTPTPNVPKNAAGEPDLTAPAPRTTDGKIDFTGIWAAGRGGGGGGGGAARGQGQGGGGARGQGQAGGAAQGQGQAGGAARGQGQRGANTAAAPAPPPPADAIPTANFGNAAGGFGLRGQNGAPDGLPPGIKPWAADLVKQRMADNSKDNPDAHCLPMGFLQFHNHPEPRKIIQTKDVIVIIYEANEGLRQIHMDGRALPGPDAEPWWYGYSVGKWEGDTLVVETRGFKDGGWLDVRGTPLTDEAKVIEKFRRPNYGSMEIEITIDDPKAYEKPWTVKVNQRIMLNTDLIEFICEERDATHYIGAEGKK
jgi:hypothetical protein